MTALPSAAAVGFSMADAYAVADLNRRCRTARGERVLDVARAQGYAVNRKKTQRLYREEGLSVRRRRGRKRAKGARAPILVEAKPNARWSLDFVHDQFACGRRFRILNVVDDFTREYATRAGLPAGEASATALDHGPNRR